MGPHHPLTDWVYVGVLNNEPRMANAPIALGQVVEFGPDHVIDALPPADWTREPANTTTSWCCSTRARRSLMYSAGESSAGASCAVS